MCRGFWHTVEGIKCWENGIPIPQLSEPLSKVIPKSFAQKKFRIFQEVERRERNMWSAPLLCEPWEHQRVQVGQTVQYTKVVKLDPKKLHGQNLSNQIVREHQRVQVGIRDGNAVAGICGRCGLCAYSGIYGCG